MADNNLAAAQQRIANLEAQLNALQAAINAIPQQQAQAAPTFALGPAWVRPNDLIDYDTRAGQKIHEHAVAALPLEFDLDRSKIRLFLSHVKTRAQEQNWLALFSITHDGTVYDMLTQYGLVQTEWINTHTEAYAFANGRTAQNSANLFAALKASLTQDAHQQLMAYESSYVITPPANAAAGTRPFNDGVRFLSLIIDQSTILTNATLTVSIEKLMNLRKLMDNVESKIDDFNNAVNGELRNYSANSATSFDDRVLLQQLFSAYKSTNDADFVASIKRTEQDHEDQRHTTTAKSLMESALRIYNTRVEKEIWGEQTSEQKELVTLTAKMETLMQANKALERKVAKGSKPKPSSANKASEPAANRERRKRETPTWMKSPPTDGKGTIKRDGKTFHWCATHKLWQEHRPEDCRLRKKLEEQAQSREVSNEPAAEAKEEELVIDANLTAIQEEENALDYDL